MFQNQNQKALNTHLENAALKAVDEITSADDTLPFPWELYELVQKETAAQRTKISIYEALGDRVLYLSEVEQALKEFPLGSPYQYTQLRAGSHAAKTHAHIVARLCRLDTRWRDLAQTATNADVVNITPGSVALLANFFRLVAAHFWVEHGRIAALEWVQTLNKPLMEAEMLAYLRYSRAVATPRCQLSAKRMKKLSDIVHKMARALVKRHGVRFVARAVPGIKKLSTALSRKGKAALSALFDFTKA
ncbi:hypothetical protein PsYK624_150090 [Phanerochaete sordida]|uniref:Uncharacterized protein n=1 Tax=Phanerochaete sordida TaxID=48140 RepID=A0A9P3LKN1_9APHY|nr:hypothetical protein PsYK624_150090 [Phanerochaete sordida]